MIYTTAQDYIAQVIEPALGEYAADYDLGAIAYDLLDWHTECDDQGREWVDRSGFVEAPGMDFWKVVARHEKNGN